MDVNFFVALLPSIITGAIAFYLQRAQRKRDEQTERRAKARKEESLLGLKMNYASAKLAYACAMAIKHGHTNGEVDEMMEVYERAKSDYYDFLNDQAHEHLV